MKTEDSRLALGLIIGAAVGAAVAGLILYNHYSEGSLVDEIQEAADKAKKRVSKVVQDGLDELEDVSDKITKKAQRVLKKAPIEE